MDSRGNGYTGCSECPGTQFFKDTVVLKITVNIKTDIVWILNVAYVCLQGKIKGYPIWSNPNSVEPFLNENATPPAACPSIVNSKAIGN